MSVLTKEAAEAKAVKIVGSADKITMYQLAGMLSEALGRRVREQMMYNYRKNGMISGLVEGRATTEAAVAFITKQLNK